MLGRAAHLEDGSGHFRDVLNTISCTENEIWIAYVTPDIVAEKVSSMIQKGTSAFESLFNVYDNFSFMDNIEMFMTVTSSPNALITTHMGISRSVENVLNNRAKGVSLDLHSFAAKVMLTRNPTRKYMVNAPTNMMETIILKAFEGTGAAHVGTKEMLNTSKDESELKLMKQYPPILSVDSARGRTIESSFTIYDQDQLDKPWLTVSKDNKDYLWIFENVFQPSLKTHFIAIDLDKLANSRKCERLDVK